ncbi:MAG TPA: hypothetical protein VFG20_21195 [Planctomycetaceae bacterium]|nr:hypothetical protein [Planctomycetaceae bacterium]
MFLRWRNRRLAPCRSPKTTRHHAGAAAASGAGAAGAGVSSISYNGLLPNFFWHLGHFALAMPLPLRPPIFSFLRPSSLTISPQPPQRKPVIFSLKFLSF